MAAIAEAPAAVVVLASVGAAATLLSAGAASAALVRSRVAAALVEGDEGRYRVMAASPRPRVVRLVVRSLSGIGSRSKRSDAIGDVLVLVAQRLRTGGSLLDAIAHAADRAPKTIGRELHSVVHRARHGAGLADALGQWSTERDGDDDVRMTAAALATAVATGGPALQAIETVSAIVADRRSLAGEIGALTAQARASAAVLGASPLVMAAVGIASDPTVARFMFLTGPGLALVFFGLLLDAIGVGWMVLLMRGAR